VTLTAIPTHLVADINFGRYDTNEMVYAKGLLPQIPEDSLTAFDKGFLAAEILCGLTMGWISSTTMSGRVASRRNVTRPIVVVLPFSSL